MATPIRSNIIGTKLIIIIGFLILNYSVLRSANNFNYFPLPAGIILCVTFFFFFFIDNTTPLFANIIYRKSCVAIILLLQLLLYITLARGDRAAATQFKWLCKFKTLKLFVTPKSNYVQYQLGTFILLLCI